MGDKPSSEAFDTLNVLKQGVEEMIPEAELLDKLKENRPLRVKLGFDPSAPDLHLGHSVILNKLRQFQDLDHHVMFLIGDFTAMIGDPSGKSITRPALTREQVLENAKTYQDQVFLVLDPDKTEIVFNSQWTDLLTATDMIKLASTYTVARMMERDDFANRYAQQKPISIHEFIYPLLQGYDSVAMKADIELGGTDQKFNLLMAREIQKHYNQTPEVIITLPIIEGLDGVKKMSKSLDNYIGLTESPEQMFGKLMSVSDELMWRYCRILMVYTPEEIEKKQQATAAGLNPRDIKLDMAKHLVARFHDNQASIHAQEQFIRRFQKGMMPEDMPEMTIPAGNTGEIEIGTVLKQIGLTSSTSEALRHVGQGAVRIDSERITDKKFHLIKGNTYICQVGKRRFAKVTVK